VAGSNRSAVGSIPTHFRQSINRIPSFTRMDKICTGVILIGGKGTRLGKEKSSLKFGYRTILDRQVRRLGSIFPKVMTIGFHPDQLHHLDTSEVYIIPDCVKSEGPLCGVYTALLNSDTPYNFVVACDMPFLQVSLIEFLSTFLGQGDVVCPVFKGYPEPLHSFYSIRCVQYIEILLKKGVRQLRRLLEMVDVFYVGEHEFSGIENYQYSFFNINTQVQSEEALKIYERYPCL
jgi:molybdopterin-guanine dinucleotide biosynthesis protein A